MSEMKTERGADRWIGGPSRLKRELSWGGEALNLPVDLSSCPDADHQLGVLGRLHSDHQGSFTQTSFILCKKTNVTACDCLRCQCVVPLVTHSVCSHPVTRQTQVTRFDSQGTSSSSMGEGRVRHVVITGLIQDRLSLLHQTSGGPGVSGERLWPSHSGLRVPAVNHVCSVCENESV